MGYGASVDGFILVMMASIMSCLSVGSLRAGIEGVSRLKGLPLMLDVVFVDGKKKKKQAEPF